jgi:hypothetical protein
MLGARLISSLEMFLGVISSNRPDKYYVCYLGGVIVFINNKFIINKDILNSEIKVLPIAKFIFLLNIKEVGQKLSFLRRKHKGIQGRDIIRTRVR